MKRRIGFPRLKNPDFRGQMHVQRRPPINGAQFGHVAVGCLPVGMYAGIGAPGPEYADGPAADTGESMLNLALYRGRRIGFFLNLPAFVGCADIGEGYFESGHAALGYSVGNCILASSSVSLATTLGSV